ncbi:MAG TPA: transporter [Fimbriimonadaceae bacterium]|nr:transporter [Fimbriimonadaceae bacterium]
MQGIGRRYALAAAVALAPSVWAFGPPFFTDDPVPVDLRHWEVYVATQYLHARDSVEGTAPHFELNYGAAPNVQVHLITPFAYAMSPGTPNQWGYGDTEFGVKYRFVEESKNMPQIGTFPLVELPTGDSSRGLGSGQTSFFIPIWMQKSWGEWSSYWGGGFWHNPGQGNRDHWFFGWQAQRQMTKSLAVGGEVFYQTADTVDGQNHTGFNVGAVYDFDEGHHLMLSLGSDIHGSALGTMYLAYQWTFGPKEKGE